MLALTLTATASLYRIIIICWEVSFFFSGEVTCPNTVPSISSDCCALGQLLASRHLEAVLDVQCVCVLVDGLLTSAQSCTSSGVIFNQRFRFRLGYPFVVKLIGIRQTAQEQSERAWCQIELPRRSLRSFALFGGCRCVRVCVLLINKRAQYCDV